MFKKKKAPVTLEEKIDEILRYQKSARNWGIVKALTNVTFFMLFIVLPIVGIFYFFNWAGNELGIDLSQAQQAIEGLKTIGETGDGFNDSVDTLIESLSGNGEGSSVPEGLDQLGLGDVDLQQVVENLSNFNERQDELMEFLDSQGVVGE